MAASKKLHELTDLQLLLLGVLWRRGEATANEVHADLLKSTGLARGTIGTLLHRLERQRVVAHRADGREFWYRTLVDREAVRAARVAGLIGGLFGGDMTALVQFAVSSNEVSKGDVDRLRALLESRGRKRS
jgi:predicted transcriptional regulator